MDNEKMILDFEKFLEANLLQLAAKFERIKKQLKGVQVKFVSAKENLKNSMMVFKETVPKTIPLFIKPEEGKGLLPRYIN
ncbi:hypothetical protein MAR_031184 [Mya arenaria]|uniref:Uncharacterized protein n=1 Tax=Mya arenaria TaxID=6604 RepID=A0ABY7F370_MYAAR|nr:hypothetical protein MAR_031184 [Mya arenaria]